MNAPAKIAPDFECIPSDLKAVPRWVLWKFTQRPDGSLGKVPQGANGNASAHEPANWMTFAVAVQALQDRLASGRWPQGGGIGFVFTDDDDIGGVDLDGCRDPETGKISAWAQRVLRAFDGAYVELSPSRAGFHIITRGAPTSLARTQRAVPAEVLEGDLIVDGKESGVEAYVAKRFFTMTGEHVTGRMELAVRREAWAQVAAFLRGDESPDSRAVEAHKAGKEPEPLGDEDIDILRSALAAFGSDDVDRNTWIAVGMALKAELGEDGRALWMEWMAKSEHDDADANEATWNGLPDRPHSVGLGTIFHYAKENGWKRPRRKGGGGGAGDGATLATILDGVELWHDRRRQAYATVTIERPDDTTHRENMPVGGSGFSGWLTREYYLATGSPPKREKLKEVIALAEARGLHEGQQHETWIRVAAADGRLYLDLGDEDWQAVEIDTAGWRIVSDPPVKFRRSGGGLALPRPVQGDAAAAIAKLGDLIRPQEPGHLMLLTGALVSYLRPGYPFVGINFDCEPGSAKTTSLRITQSLIDPQVAATPGPPSTEKDLNASAQNRHLVRFDNVSHITAEMSDAYCRLLTGGGSSVRKLYANEEAHDIDVKRPICMTLISVTMRSDLADRSIVIPLQAIGEAERLPEEELNRRVAEARPIILGALLDGASVALRRMPEVKNRFIGQLPRMADFALWAEAAGEAFGWTPGHFLETYREHITDRRVADAQDDPICSGIFDWLCSLEDGVVEGPAGDLRQRLFDRWSFRRAPQWFPASARAFAGALARNRKQLEALGVTHSERPHPHSRTAGRIHRLELNGRGREHRDLRRSQMLAVDSDLD